MIHSKIYLAIPFTGIEELSFKCANEVASLLLAEGHYVYSPISHSYPIWNTGMVDHTYDVWLRLDKEFVTWADVLYVVTIKGMGERTKNSKGVNMEIAWANEQNKTIVWIIYDPETKKIDSHKKYPSKVCGIIPVKLTGRWLILKLFYQWWKCWNTGGINIQ
jgi:hypothetical protein